MKQVLPLKKDIIKWMDESLILCIKAEKTEFGQFRKFETVTISNIDKPLIEISLLDHSEIEWFDYYHKKVFEKLNPYLSESEMNCLSNKTSGIFISH
jgi:Xaa-Pro aminopeptidase